MLDQLLDTSTLFNVKFTTELFASVQLVAFSTFSELLWASQVAQWIESACRCRRHGFDPCVPFRRKWQPTPVFFPGECHGERSLVKVTKSLT